MPQTVDTVPLHLATSERYLSYAISVITSRALPDVRDGLKPVQRRILYTMYNDLGLVATGRYKKCAGVVGDVMGKYHPHGDSSIYEALVRMVQSFSLRAPLIDGQGNFGSLDGDPPAAFRYTECKLMPIAEELLTEIRKQTVDFRPSYDGQREEPVVLPAQFPHLLVNGSEGIAVGMATRIPPHNLAEVISACIALIDDRSLTVRDLMRHVQGPDFPTGGRILTPPSELEKIYETGQGTLKVRATWAEVTEDGARRIVLDSVPYGQNKAKLVEHIGEEVRTRRLPQVVDVRDESTDEVRIVLDLAPDAAAETVMAYLFKRTDLQTTWPVNLTALVPVPGSAVCSPARLDLKQMLEHWLTFRLETVRRRYQYDLEQLRQRIHILEGFATIFDALDEAIRIIRASSGKKDAAASLIGRFQLSQVQADAILELQLYKLAKLEIEEIRAELADKLQRAAQIEQLLASEPKLWNEVRKELKEIRKHHGAPRSALLGEAEALEFDADAYIVAEDTYVVVSRDGWIKRQSSFRELDKVRVREGDEIGWLVKADTRSTLTFFTNQGGAYVMRVDAVPQTTGYGEPVQASFTFADGEVVVAARSNDPRHAIPARPLGTPDDPPTPYAAAVTAAGRGMRFSLPPHADVSNRTGRRFARLLDGDQVLAVWGLPGEDDPVRLATSAGRKVELRASELPILKGAGKGLPVVALEPGEGVVAFELGGEGPVVTPAEGARGRKAHRWVRPPQVLDLDPTRTSPAAAGPLAPYTAPPRTGPTAEEKQAAAEQKAATRLAAAAARAAAREQALEQAEARRRAAELRAREKHAAAEQKAAERLAAAVRRAAEKEALESQKAAQKQRQEEERRAAAERKAAEQREVAERKAAEKAQLDEERRAAAAAVAAARAAEQARKQQEKRAAAEQKAAEKALEVEARRAAAEVKAAEKAQLDEARRAEKAAAKALADQQRQEKAAAEAAAKSAEKARKDEQRRLAAEAAAAEKAHKDEQRRLAAQAAAEAAAEKAAEKARKDEQRRLAAEAAAEKAAEKARNDELRKAAAAEKAAEKARKDEQRRLAAEAAAEKAAEKARKDEQRRLAAEAGAAPAKARRKKPDPE